MESSLRSDRYDPTADPDFRLIETFGYHPGQGFPRLELHMARMSASAAALGLCFEPSGVAPLLPAGERPLRCRLTLDTQGQLALTTAPLVPLAPGRLVFAEQRLDSTDPWLRHKSTRRGLYDQVRKELPAGVAEAIFLNERDELCEGTITTLFVQTAEGAHVTPPLDSGVLPGVLRQSLLDKGACREGVLTRQDLDRARRVWIGNSLRGEVALTFDGRPQRL